MAYPIMIQGTMSNAGKSFLAAALCRIFHQDGYRTTPFKSQNMALNSYITQEGAEIGRAQAMQAQAAGIEPAAQMNPVLLKPTCDVGSQVIVNGVPIGDMSARDYYRRKKELVPQIRRAYDALAAEYEIIVIEGAGSPVELNLNDDDFVNMGMARLVDAPVLLVGDIDRGGVFAQLLGTLMLFEEEERARVKGLIVNQFRGDITLFDDGVKILEERGGVPVLGVVPHIRVDLEDEDSLSEKLSAEGGGLIDIAVIRFPRISNFTDFDVFRQYEGVSVRYVTDPHRLGRPDLILLPGTKSTIADLKWMRTGGLEIAVRRAAADGVPVFGICGGYQMLGGEISDPQGAEGGGVIEGLGLLSGRTVFEPEKRRTQTCGHFADPAGFFACLSGAAYEGYEIHMGVTHTDGAPLLTTGENLPSGESAGNVCGCYVHGIFDAPEVSEALVRALFERKGIPFSGGIVDRKAYKEQQFDILADAVRGSLDMDLLYDIVFRQR